MVTDQGLVLHIRGRIAVDELEVLRTALGEASVVAFELAEIELVDRDAVKLLALHEAKVSSSDSVRLHPRMGDERANERRAPLGAMRNRMFSRTSAWQSATRIRRLHRHQPPGPREFARLVAL